MPRPVRLVFPGAVYHVMSRGNRKALVYHDDHDRLVFLGTLGSAIQRYRVQCLAFCLMPNHYHLVLKTPEGNLSHAMRHLNGVYTQASNRRYRRTGHVFEGRFRSVVVDSEPYLCVLGRYVVLNPVRAGLVADVACWRWSSYCATAGIASPPQWLETTWIKGVFGTDRLAEAQTRYRQFVAATPIPQPVEDNLQGEVSAAAVRSSAFAEASDSPDGSASLAVPSLDRPSLSALLANVGHRGLLRNRRIESAYVVYAYPMTEIAAFLGCVPSAVSKVLQRRRLGRSAAGTPPSADLSSDLTP